MRNIGPCMCGDTECPSCGPAQGYPLGSLDAEDIDALAEAWAADDEAERVYQEMQDQEAFLAEQEAAARAAEQWYAENDTKPVETDLL